MIRPSGRNQSISRGLYWRGPALKLVYAIPPSEWTDPDLLTVGNEFTPKPHDNLPALIQNMPVA